MESGSGTRDAPNNKVATEKKEKKKSKTIESDGSLSLVFDLAQSRIHAHAHTPNPTFSHISIPGFFLAVKFP